MDFKYKKGEKLKFLFNGGEGTGTCYTPGETVTVQENSTDDFISVVGEIHQIRQTVYSCQVERISNSFNLPVVEQCIVVYENDVITHIVKINTVCKNLESTVNITGAHLSVKEKVFYNNAVAVFDFTDLHTFKEPNVKEQYWFDWCLAANKFVSLEDVPFIGEYVLIRPDNTITLTGIVKGIEDSCVIISDLKNPKAILAGTHANFVINDKIKKVTKEFVLDLYKKDSVAAAFREPISDANGGFKIGDYILIEHPVEASKISKITGFSTSQERNTIYAYLTCISSLKELKTNWFTCISGNNTTTSPLDENQIHWLDYCIEQNQYVTYEDIPKLSKETQSIAFPGSGWCSTADEEIGHYLAKKCDAPYVPPGSGGYAWSYNSYWKIDVASGKPHWTKEFLKKIIKQETFEKDVDKVREIPFLKFKRGETVKICKTRFEEPAMHRFKLGAIVTIKDIEPIDTLPYRCCLPDSSDFWWVAEEDLEKYQEDTLKVKSFKKGDTAKIIASPVLYTHKFNIGEVVECIEVGEPQSLFSSKERPDAKWWLYPREYKIESQPFGKMLITGTGNTLDGIKSNFFLVDEMGQREKYIGGIDSIDDWKNTHVWIQDPSLAHRHISETPWGLDLVAPDKDVPTDNLASKFRKLFNLGATSTPPILKDRTVKPVEVKSKIKNIDNGLIVPLEPIKNRIIK